jgi:hypothetical protein
MDLCSKQSGLGTKGTKFARLKTRLKKRLKMFRTIRTVIKKALYPSIIGNRPVFCCVKANVAKLVDALNLGSSAERHVGSIPYHPH